MGMVYKHGTTGVAGLDQNDRGSLCRLRGRRDPKRELPETDSVHQSKITDVNGWTNGWGHVIKQLHRDLLQYSSKDESHQGEYKTLNNHVEAFGPGGENLGIVFETAGNPPFFNRLQK